MSKLFYFWRRCMYLLREAKHEDVQTLKRLYRYFVLDMSRFEPSDDNLDDEILFWIETSLIGEKSVIFVAENDKGISGFVRIQQKERKNENGNEIIHYAKLSDLYVLPEARKNGIASKLVNASIDWAKKRKLLDLILNVYEKNEPARALYTSFGFQIDDTISHNRVRMKYIFT